MRNGKEIAIIGTVGVPAAYGGFETLAENLIKYHAGSVLPDSITVYCSSKGSTPKKSSYLSAKLKYVPLNANGVQSIPYDIFSMLTAWWCQTDVILLLGVSGAVMLPFIRFVSKVRIVTNIDGIEWRRAKWNFLARWFLRLSEKMAVRYSHEVISDNEAIAAYVRETYNVDSHVIAYGGDHAVLVDAQPIDQYGLPESYAFSVCRIEPENNVHMIVEAFSRHDALPLVMVGNWDNSDYGRSIRSKYLNHPGLYLLDPIYELGRLKTLRDRAKVYVHGHSAGGTNPSLVEAMHFGRPVLAFDCSFNRHTTGNMALFFNSVETLINSLTDADENRYTKVGRHMQEIAQDRYTWSTVAKSYFFLLDRV